MKNLKLLDGFEMPNRAFGTWIMCNGKCENLVKQAIEVGYRHIDTAWVYGNMEPIQRAMKETVGRKNIYITSKVWPKFYYPIRFEKNVDEMLMELRTEYLDMLLLHWDDESLNLENFVPLLLKMKTTGKTKSIGLSNFSKERFYEAQILAEGKLVINQVKWEPEIKTHYGDGVINSYYRVPKGQNPQEVCLVKRSSNKDHLIENLI